MATTQSEIELVLYGGSGGGGGRIGHQVIMGRGRFREFGLKVLPSSSSGGS